MQTVEEFLAYSIHLEQEAATRFGELADAMEARATAKSGIVPPLSDYSRLHLADAKARAGFREMPEIAAGRISSGRIWKARKPRRSGAPIR